MVCEGKGLHLGPLSIKLSDQWAAQHRCVDLKRTQVRLGG
ncbi:MAG: hypothetical protein ACJAYU_000305 [Bradymonadia bacterium]